MERADVVVVGGGPAGAAAAITLASAGREVVLVDKARFPRDKCCGDGLTTLALRELEALGLRPEVIPSWTSVDAAWCALAVGARGRAPAAVPAAAWHAAVAPPIELDAALVDLAAPDGRQGARRSRRSPPSTRAIVVRSSSRSTGTSAVAADTSSPPTACGRRSRKALGLAEPGYLGEWHAFRQYFTGVTGRAADRAVGVVRARPPARLRLVVPARRRAGQRRLRHPACAAASPRGA